MRLLKVGAAAVNQTPLDWDGNKRNILEAIARAKAAGVSLLCLPEMTLSGYGCEDAFGSPGLRRTAREVLAEILPETAGIAVCLGLPVLHRNALYNSAAFVVDGAIRGFVAKRHLAGEGLHYEPRWFKAWPEGVVEAVEYDGVRYPLGDVHFDVGGVRVGFEICEDAWVAQRPGGALSRRGVDVILNPSASHFAFDKQDVRRRFVTEGSRAFGVTYVYSNLLGNEAGRVIYDGGTLIATEGGLVAEGERLGLGPVVLTTAVVDVDATRTAQARTASFEPEHGADDACVAVAFQLPGAEPVVQAHALPEWETADDLREEEFTRAVTLGLWDYLRKSRSNGFVVSLSGGADSAACAALVRLTLDRAETEGAHDRPAAEAAKEMLTCVYQATENSSATTFEAARKLSEALGADFMRFDVQALVDGYEAMVSEAIGRPLTWEDDDVARQNIQARVRAPGVWMIANLRNALLLATSNRSEAAVGYATMDGDTCGGLSPIAGIDKAFLRRWLKWMEQKGPAGLGPIPALSIVNALTPTAELRPLEANQTDEDDLMPYPVLDAIEDLAIGEKHEPVATLRLLEPRFEAYDLETLGAWVERFFVLWSRNQWKRERYAPSFHVDDKNLDPKTWCRFPILSGGFERELAEMRAYVAGG